ncbi:hypothetical protein Nmel_005330, partial [Mimus melanotis]
MQSVADSSCVCGGRPAVGCPGEAGAGLTLPARRWGNPRESWWAIRPRCWLPVLPSPAAAAPAIPPSLPASRPSVPVASRCHPGLPARSPFSLALPGRERSLTHPSWDPAHARGSSLSPHPWKKGNAAPDSSCTQLVRGSRQGRLAAPAMPHFLDWFVPVYLMISILILVGFGACIYYFEPGLQEAHKWRTQRPIMERDLRKTLMIRDNLAFGVPE